MAITIEDEVAIEKWMEKREIQHGTHMQRHTFITTNYILTDWIVITFYMYSWWMHVYAMKKLTWPLNHTDCELSNSHISLTAIKCTQHCTHTNARSDLQIGTQYAYKKREEAVQRTQCFTFGYNLFDFSLKVAEKKESESELVNGYAEYLPLVLKWLCNRRCSLLCNCDVEKKTHCGFVERVNINRNECNEFRHQKNDKKNKTISFICWQCPIHCLWLIVWFHFVSFLKVQRVLVVCSNWRIDRHTLSTTCVRTNERRAIKNRYCLHWVFPLSWKKHPEKFCSIYLETFDTMQPITIAIAIESLSSTVCLPGCLSVPVWQSL